MWVPDEGIYINILIGSETHLVHFEWVEPRENEFVWRAKVSETDTFPKDFFARGTSLEETLRRVVEKYPNFVDHWRQRWADLQEYDRLYGKRARCEP